MNGTTVVPLAMGLGAPEILIILVILVLLFGAKKLPELARGSGRALRIFKAETKGLLDDDDDKLKTEEQRQIDAAQRREAATRLEAPQEQPGQPRPDSER
jgi:sec-independent protein translocase protein TatA